VFGTDEPAGNYDDIEHTDTMVAVGRQHGGDASHPVVAHQLTAGCPDKNCRMVNITTFSNMTSNIADLEIIIKPAADLAIQNYIAREICTRDAVNKAFVEKHCAFVTGPYDIGYGFRPKNAEKFASAEEMEIVKEEQSHTLDKWEAIAQRRQEGDVIPQASAADPGKHWLISFDDFKKALEPYTLDFVAEVAKGDPDEPLDSSRPS
jgi:nitrate reductase (cytochrome)